MSGNESAPPAPRKKSRKLLRFFRILLFLAFLLFLIVLAVPWFLPALVEDKVNEILKDMTAKGDGSPYVEIREIGLFHTSFSVDLRRERIPDMSGRRFTEDDFGIASVSFDYSPLELLTDSRIRSIRIDGVRVPLMICENTVLLPLWEKLQWDLTPSASSSAGGGNPFDGLKGLRLDTLPVKIGSVQVNGTLFLQIKDREKGPALDAVLLPIQCGIVTHPDNMNVVDWHGSLHGGSNFIAASGVLDLPKMRATGEARIRLNTATTPYTLRTLMKEDRNSANIVSEISFDLDLKDPFASTVSGALRGRLQASAAAADLTWEPDFDFSMSDKKLSVKAGHLRVLCAGEELVIPEATCLFYPEHSYGTGTIRAASGRGPGITAKYELQPSPNGDAWRLTLNSEASPEAQKKHLSAQLGAGKASLSEPEFDVRADFSSPIAFGASALLRNLQLAQPGWSLELADIALAGEGDLSAFGATLRTGPLHFRYGENATRIQSSFPGLFLNVRRKKGEDGLHLIFEAADGTCDMPEKNLSMNGISLSQTVSLKEKMSGDGEFRIAAIRLDDKSLGDFRAKTTLRDGAFLAEGPLALCGLRADCRAEGHFSPFSASCGLQLPEQAIPGEALAELFPDKIGDKIVSGRIEASAEYALADGKQRGSARIRLTDGAVTSESMKLSVDGIRGDVTFPNLPELRTLPNQPLSCRNIRFGNIAADGARLRFRLDSLQSICAERLTLNWCGGKVRMECTYFEPGTDSLAVTVHCDRLDLLQFLTQTGAGTGESNGGGRISGTLPVFFNRKTRKLSVRNAFLYSTPGEEGRIQFMMNESIRNAQEKSVTFDMTQDALRNFEYSWARVQMGTEDGTLKLQLQLNGKPAAPLYYSYGENGIVKSQVPHVFQGIRLDVNLNLPLDVLFELMEDYNLLNQNLQP